MASRAVSLSRIVTRRRRVRRDAGRWPGWEDITSHHGAPGPNLARSLPRLTASGAPARYRAVPRHAAPCRAS